MISKKMKFKKIHSHVPLKRPAHPRPWKKKTKVITEQTIQELDYKSASGIFREILTTLEKDKRELDLSERNKMIVRLTHGALRELCSNINKEFDREYETTCEEREKRKDCAQELETALDVCFTFLDPEDEKECCNYDQEFNIS